MCVVVIYQPVCDPKKIWNYPDLCNQVVFSTWLKSQDKIYSEQKELSRWNKKHFSLFSNGFYENAGCAD